LGPQGRQRTAAVRMLDVGHAQVDVQAALHPGAWSLLLGRLAQALKTLAEFTLDDRGKQLGLGRKVAVERAAAQADGLQQAVDTGGGEAPAFGDGTAAAKQLLAGLRLVIRRVTHSISTHAACLTMPEP